MSYSWLDDFQSSLLVRAALYKMVVNLVILAVAVAMALLASIGNAYRLEINLLTAATLRLPFAAKYSRLRGREGIGVVNFLSFSTGPIASSFTAETFALKQGLDWCTSHLMTCKFQ